MFPIRLKRNMASLEYWSCTMDIIDHRKMLNFVATKVFGDPYPDTPLLL